MTTATSVTESLLLDEVTSAIAWEHFERNYYVYPLLCDIRPSAKGREQVATYTGLGTLEAVAEGQAAPEDKPQAQWEKQFVHVEYKKKTLMSEVMLEDQDFQYLTNLGLYYGAAVSDTFDANEAAKWNGAFTTTLAADALSLCNDAHLNKAGANSQDNSITGALGVTVLGTMRKALRDLKDSRGNPMHNARLTTLLLPTGLEESGLELARSTDRPDTPNRATNIYFGNIDVIVWNRLTTSATAFFGLDMQMVMQNNLMLMRRTPNFFGFGDPDTGNRMYGANVRYTHGFVDWRGVIGSSGV